MSNSNKSGDILVIGNGFDVYHGMSTRYSDFLEFAKSIQEANEYNSQIYRVIF